MSHILLFCIRHLARENKSAPQANLVRITSKFERPNQLNSRYKLAIKLLTSAILLSGTILSKSARAKKPFESYTTIPIPGTSFSYTAGSNNYTFGSGNDLQLESITADGGTIYTPQELADQIFIRRVDNTLVSGDRCNIFVERGSGNFDAESSFPNEGGNCSVAEVLKDLIVNRGVLDVFSNQAGGANSEQPNNIERVDFVFSQGIIASTDPTQLDEAGHIVMEKSGNNPVKVAAITAIDAAGNPTAFKPTRVTINSSDYGRTGAQINNNFLVDPSTSGGVSNPQYQRNTDEQVGGVLVTLDDFGIGAGEVYYGFAMFGTDVPDATDLLQPQTFPQNTPHGVGNTGGADWQGGMGGFWYSDEYEPGNLLLSGQVFEDTNDSDLLENNKPRLNDISVSIYLDDGDDAFETDGSDVLIGTTETNLGRYNFSNLAPNQKYWVRVDPDDVDLNGYSYGGGDVVADQVNPRLVSITTQEVANINFPFDVDAPESIDSLNVCYLVADGHTGPENSGQDLLTKLNRVTGEEIAVGDGTGTSNIEAIAFDAVNNILYAGNAGQFGVINLSTGVFSQIGGTNFGDIDGLAIDPFSREIFASIRRPSGALDQLIKIDPATGTRIADAFGTGVDTVDIAAVSGFTDIDDITVDPQTGQIYGVANNNGGGDTLVTITPSPSGASTASVGTLGVQDVEGFSSFFDGSRFFGTTGSSSASQNPDSFYRIDVDTGNSIYNFRLGINFGGGVTTDYEAVDCATTGFNTLSGKVFSDSNINGVFDGSDTATSNVTVQLYRDRNGDGILDNNDDVSGDGVLNEADLLASQETDGNGDYTFQFEATGAFIVQVDPADLPPGVTFTTNGGNNLETADFGSNVGNSITDKNFGYEVALDFGDAPDTYGTDLTANNSSNSNDPIGASHIITSNLYLGATIPDQEIDGFVDGTDDNNNASDDDETTGNGNGDDEDNFTLPTLTQGDPSYTIPAANITATNNTGKIATLHAWIDFNQDGVFQDSEHKSTTVDDNTNNANPAADLTWNSITVNNSGATYARFRLTTDSTITDLTPGDEADDGEVEDYQMAIATSSSNTPPTVSCPADYDLKTFYWDDTASSSPTEEVLFWQSGTRNNLYNINGNLLEATLTEPGSNVIFRNTTTFNDTFDPPGSGLHWQMDSSSNTQSETFTLEFDYPLAVSQFVIIDIDASSGSNPTRWHDEMVFSAFDSGTSLPVTLTPANPSKVTIAGNTAFAADGVGSTTNSSSSADADVTITMLDAADELEIQFNNGSRSQSNPNSHGIGIGSFVGCLPRIDLGDAPDDSDGTSQGDYQTRTVDDGARHRIVAGLHLGNSVDADSGTLQNTNATADDDDNLNDDDGVRLNGNSLQSQDLARGDSITLDIATQGSGVLNAWIDWDNDGDFLDLNEQIATNAVENGTGDSDTGTPGIQLEVTVPTGATIGNTFARFRYSSDSNLAPTGKANDGEVEDYQVAIANTLLCPTARADLWFANDESGSVNNSEFQNSLDFIYQVSDQFEYGESAGIKAGIFGWAANTPNSATNNVIIPITDTFGDPGDTGLLSSSNISTDGDNQGVREEYTSKTVPSSDSSTRLDRATNYLADLIIAGAANGGRANTPQVAIILTDATSSQITSSSSGGGINWIFAAEKLRVDAGAAIILIIIDDAADAYTANNNNEQGIINSVIGDNGQLLVVPTYTEAADATEGYVTQAAQSVCDSTTPVSTDPELLLTKRITAINPGQADEVTFADFVDDESSSDNNAKWPNSTDNGGTFTNSYTVGTTNGGEVIPGDILEYTIYYLSSGEEAANNVLVCDLIPDNTELVTNDFDTVTPAPGGTAGLERGLVIESNGNLQSLTNDQDGDRGYYFPPGIEPSTVFPNVQCSDSNLPNTNGAIVVNLGDVPRATASGDPIGSFGFIRFRARVK